MATYNLNDLKDNLLEYKTSLKEQIKKEILICFVNDFYKKRINNNLNLEEINLKNTFSSFLMLSFIEDFYKKNFNSVSNYNLISQYLDNTNIILKKQIFEKILIINAVPIKKDDKDFNDFLSSLEVLKKDISIKNLGWYENDWFDKDIKLFNNLETNLTKLKKEYYTFDKDLFDKITNNKFINIKLDFKKMYHEFFNKDLFYSFEKFIFIPENYNKSILIKKEEKIIESISNNTLIIFNNNIKLDLLSKTGFLNNLNLFYKIIKNNCPIIFKQDHNNFFNIISPLILKKINNYLELTNLIILKQNEIKLEKNHIAKNNENDLLNKFWDDVLKDHLNSDTDLKQINNLDIKFNLKNDFNKLIKDLTVEVDELELDINKNIEYKNLFNKYIKLFDNYKNKLEIINKEFNLQKYESFKQKTNNFNLKQTYDFINKNFNLLKLTLNNLKIDKQDALNCYTLYLKAKTCYDQILILED